MSNTAHKADTRLRCYPDYQIDAVWGTYSPLIQKALDQGSEYTLWDIYNGLRNREMQLWTWDTEAAMVTAIQTDKVKFCLILTIAGKNMSDWVHYLPIVEDWAKDNGCHEMRLYGRIGWAKITGYSVDWTRMSKWLQDRRM
jgi:hypothetical protein